MLSVPHRALHGFFLERAGAPPLFCTLHRPASGPSRGAVLCLPPLGEELNRSRRACATTARALAQAGYTVLLVDLRGCGDSAGQLADTHWPDWLDDAEAGLQWLQQACPEHTPWLWTVRSGALLAQGLIERQGVARPLLLWQPQTDGEGFVRQWLRLHGAGALAAGDSAQVMAQARQAWAEGRTVDIAGYAWPGPLMQALGQRRGAPPPGQGQPLVWLDIGPGPADRAASPVATQALSAWQQAGWPCRFQAVQAPAFWQSAEIETAPALATASLAALHGNVHA
jgi:exosortase A-associated hydrolase 2